MILKLNGDELAGKIQEITDTEVNFTYTGETLAYAFKTPTSLKSHLPVVELKLLISNHGRDL